MTETLDFIYNYPESGQSVDGDYVLSFHEDEDDHGGAWICVHRHSKWVGWALSRREAEDLAQKHKDRSKDQ